MPSGSGQVGPAVASGVSTGALPRSLTWTEAVGVARAHGASAVELAALSAPEWPSLCAFLQTGPELPFSFVSVHAPTKGVRMPDDQLAAEIAALPGRVDAVVQHPDVVASLAPYARLGRRFVIENMDPRKATGRTVAELAPVFAAGEDVGFCFDIAHAAAVDPTLAEAHALLDAFGGRLSHVHVSELDASGRHVPLSADGAEHFAPVLRRCAGRPWIYEA